MHFFSILFFLTILPKLCLNIDEIVEVPESPPARKYEVEILTENPPESPKPEKNASRGYNFKRLAKTVLYANKFSKNVESIKAQKRINEKFKNLVKKAQIEDKNRPENKMNEITKHWKSAANKTQSLRAEYLSKIVKPDKYYWPQEFGGIVEQVFRVPFPLF